MAKYVASKGTHDMANVQKSDVAMMTVFNVENKKMEEIKKMRDRFQKEKEDRFLELNRKLHKANMDKQHQEKKE